MRALPVYTRLCSHRPSAVDEVCQQDSCEHHLTIVLDHVEAVSDTGLS